MSWTRLGIDIYNISKRDNASIYEIYGIRQLGVVRFTMSDNWQTARSCEIYDVGQLANG